jgi:hypothetical protein
MQIDAQILRELLAYDPLSGVMTWKKARGRMSAGQVAGNVHHKGYIEIKVMGQTYGAHVLAWVMQTGEWPDVMVDHIDGNGLNNVFLNLRKADHQQNGWNQKLSIANTTGYRGVSRTKDGMYVAQIGTEKKKRKCLGRFNTAEEAAHAYNKAAIRYHGDFARLDPVGGNYA